MKSGVRLAALHVPTTPMTIQVQKNCMVNFKSNHRNVLVSLSRRPVGINGRLLGISWYEAGRMGEGKKFLESE